MVGEKVSRPRADLPLKVYYRLSDFAQFTQSAQGGQIKKVRPAFFDKRKCLDNFVNTFATAEISILADNVGQETWDWLQQQYSGLDLRRSSYGNGAASFRDVLELAVDLEDNRMVYFVEDDYLHIPKSATVLSEGFKYAEYLTLYDHPDKYINADQHGENGVPGNPTISQESEQTRVYKTAHTHWKETVSATMTFAASRDVLRADKDLIDFYVRTDFPRDYRLFSDLTQKVKRKLLVPLPSYSTHCESAFLAPFRDWQALS